jgi:Ca-activated chloride channel family protein
MILRGSPNKGAASFDLVLALAEQGRGEDRSGYRREFAELVRAAARLKGAVTER